MLMCLTSEGKNEFWESEKSPEYFFFLNFEFKVRKTNVGSTSLFLSSELESFMLIFLRWFPWGPHPLLSCLKRVWVSSVFSCCVHCWTESDGTRQHPERPHPQVHGGLHSTTRGRTAVDSSMYPPITCSEKLVHHLGSHLLWNPEVLWLRYQSIYTNSKKWHSLF